MERSDWQLTELFGMHEKHVIVTGASSGIGAAIAELFVAVSAKAVVTATTPSKVEAVAAMLKEKTQGRADAIGVVTDVSDQGDPGLRRKSRPPACSWRVPPANC